MLQARQRVAVRALGLACGPVCAWHSSEQRLKLSEGGTHRSDFALGVVWRDLPVVEQRVCLSTPGSSRLGGLL